MKRPAYAVAALVIAADVIASTIWLHAPGLGLLAVPYLVTAYVARRHPRAGAWVMLPSGLLILALSAPRLFQSLEFIDRQFAIVGTVAGLTGLVDAARTAFRGNRVAPATAR